MIQEIKSLYHKSFKSSQQQQQKGNKTMLYFLINTAKLLIIFSYLIVGLYIIDITETRFEYMTYIDYVICSIGTVFIIASMLTLHFFTCIKK
jgi:hypothetical protein